MAVTTTEKGSNPAVTNSNPPTETSDAALETVVQPADSNAGLGGLTSLVKTGLQGVVALGANADPAKVANAVDSISQDVTERQKLTLEREQALNQVRLKEMELQLQAAKQERDDAITQAQLGARTRLQSVTEMLRGIVLLLVVVTLVAVPVVIMLRAPITPETFAQYMAPVTGIAGTVIGYWFGKQDPKQ